jgi:hypothetical protein
MVFAVMLLCGSKLLNAFVGEHASCCMLQHAAHKLVPAPTEQ